MQYTLSTGVYLLIFRPDTKFAVFDHVTSVHALVLPIKVCIIIRTYTYIHTYIHTSYVHTYIHVCTYIHTYIYTYKGIMSHLCMYVRMYVCNRFRLSLLSYM